MVIIKMYKVKKLFNKLSGSISTALLLIFASINPATTIIT